MQVIRFQIGSHAFAVDTTHVIEVAPWIVLRPLPHAPAYLVGVFIFRGRVVPVVDLAIRMGSPACTPRLSTRILVVQHRPNALLGLLAEHVNDLLTLSRDCWRPSTVSLPDAPFLGPVAQTEKGLLQLIEVNCVLPENLVVPGGLSGPELAG